MAIINVNVNCAMQELKLLLRAIALLYNHAGEPAGGFWAVNLLERLTSPETYAAHLPQLRDL